MFTTKDISLKKYIYMSSEKNSLKNVKKIPYEMLNRIINKARKYLKNDEIWQKLCEEYDETPDIIDYIPIKFENLNVSAKCDHGIIYLNYKLLCDDDFYKNYSYFIHEGTHWFQQCYSTKPTKSSDDGSYLDNPFEQEGFANQVEYISNHEGESKAEEYVDDLLEHHEIDSKKEVEDKKEKLMAKI